MYVCILQSPVYFNKEIYSISFKQLYHIYNIFGQRSFFILKPSIKICKDTSVHSLGKKIIVKNEQVLGHVFKSLALLLNSYVTSDTLLNLSEPHVSFASLPTFIEYLWCSIGNTTLNKTHTLR